MLCLRNLERIGRDEGLFRCYRERDVVVLLN